MLRISHTLHVETDLLGYKIIAVYSKYERRRSERVRVITMPDDYDSKPEHSPFGEMLSIRGYRISYTNNCGTAVFTKIICSKQTKPGKIFNMLSPSIFSAIRPINPDWQDIPELPVSICSSRKSNIIYHPIEAIVASRFWTKSLLKCVQKLQGAGINKIWLVIQHSRYDLMKTVKLSQNECQSLELVLSRAGLRLNSRLSGRLRHSHLRFG